VATFTLEPQYLYKLASMPRGFVSNSPVDHKCNVPLYTIVVDFLSNCLLCDCDGWLPLPVGKVLDFQSIQEVLSCSAARLIQKDVTSGHFSWCAVDHCGIRNGDRLRNRVSLSINIDESCNLQCPSCRRESIMISQGEEYENKLQAVERILQWLDSWQDPIHIIMSGNGDPLASHIMRPLIKNFPARDSQTITLFTNGLLIEKQLQNLPILDHIKEFSISVDAGSKEIYEDVRRPGKWEVLKSNLEFVKRLGNNSKTRLNFALQNKNYKDLPNFVELCHHFGFIGNVHHLDDWGTWQQTHSKVDDIWTIKNGIFADHNVLDQSHPNHLDAVKVINQCLGQSHIHFSHNLLLKIQNDHMTRSRDTTRDAKA